MNKPKSYTKMILDRLNKKSEYICKKSHENSNQKTQATPTDNNNYFKVHQIRHFFDDFEKNCAIIHEPTILKNQKKNVKRILFFQLSELEYKMYKTKQSSEKMAYERFNTLPISTSEFFVEEERKLNSKLVNKQNRDNKSNNYIKKIEEKVYSSCKPIVPCNSLQRYKSMKIITNSNAPTTNTRRLLPSQPSQGIMTYDSNLRESKLEKRREPSQKKLLLKKCESYEKYFQSKRLY